MCIYTTNHPCIYFACVCDYRGCKRNRNPQVDCVELEPAVVLAATTAPAAKQSESEKDFTTFVLLEVPVRGFLFI